MINAGVLGLVVIAMGLGPVAAQELRLMRLPGDTVDVHYTPGSLDRAAHVQRRLEVLAATLTDWTEYPVGLVVYVLDRQDWERSNAGPHYGVPGRVTGDALAIAAVGDMELARFWQHLLGRAAPQLPGVPLIGPPEGADALAISDLFLQLEATAAMLRQPGWTANTPLTTRLAVHLTAWDVLSVREPERVAQLERIFSDLGRWPRPASPDRGLVDRGVDWSRGALLPWREDRSRRNRQTAGEEDP